LAKVTVKLLTTFGGRLVKDDGEVEAADVAHALDRLADKHGEDLRDEIYDGKAIRNFYIVLHNGVAVDREHPGDVSLCDGDTVHIFPPVSGG